MKSSSNHTILALPEDVRLIIFNKLGSQDPVSLILATLACKSAYSMAERNPSLWEPSLLGETQFAVPEEQLRQLTLVLEEFKGCRKLLVGQKVRRWKNPSKVSVLPVNLETIDPERKSWRASST